MALVVKDRVKDTTTTTGTGTITLANSPPNGYQAFSSLGDGSTTYYAIEDADKTDWEVGIGTYTLSGHTLARTTVLASSNSGNAVNLSSGSHTVFCDYPSGKAFLSDEGIDKTFTASGTVTAGKPMQLKTDGTAEQIFKDVTTTNYDPQNATSQDASEDWYTGTQVYNANTDTILLCHSDRDNYYAEVTPATPNADGTLTLGTRTVVASVGTYGGKIATHTTDNEFMVLVGYSSTQTPKVYVGTVGGTASARTVSFGTGVSVDTKTSYYGAIEYDSNVDRYVVGQWLDNNGGQQQGEQYYYVISVSGTVPTIKNSGGTKCFSGWDSDGGYASGSLAFCFDANENRMLLIANGISDDATNFKVMCQTVEITTTGINGTSNTPVILDSDLNATSGHAQSESQMSMVYNPDTNKILIGYIWRGASDADSRVRIKIADVSSTSVSLGTKTTVGSVCGRNVTCGYDENLDKFCVIRDMGSTSPYSTSFYNMTVDGSDNITLSAEVVVATSGTLWTVNNNFPNRMAYAPTACSNFVTMVSGSGVASKMWSFQSKKVVTTLNFDADRYLGVASTSATNGNEVQVNMPDKSINVDQTGLTIGEEYFTDNEGAVRPFYSGGASLTTGEYLGTAVSATDLQLKETPTELIGNSSASITKGKPVVVEADGDLIEVTGSTTNVSYSKGTMVEINAGTNDKRTVTYDVAQNKFLAVYRDQDHSSNVYARVLTVSSNAITVGSETQMTSHNSTTIDSVYIGDSKHVIVYKNDSTTYGTAIVATVSGTSVSFGTPVVFNSAATHYRGTCYWDSDKERVVWFGGTTGSSTAAACVMSVSGTAITAGTVTTTGENTTDWHASAYNEEQKVGLVYYSNDQDDGKLRTISVSGLTPTFNTQFAWTTYTAVIHADGITYDPVSKKCFITFRDSDDSNKLKGIVVTISDTIVTVGTEAEIYADQGYNSACQGTNQGGIAVVFRDGASPYYLKSKIATISGTGFTLSNSDTLNGAATGDEPSVAYSSSDNSVIALTGVSNDLYGVSLTPEGTISSTNLTAANYIGIAKSSSSAANKTAIITVDGGVDSNQSELTAGQLYYVQTDGTISTTAGSPSVVAGIGLSATKLLVTKS